MEPSVLQDVQPVLLGENATLWLEPVPLALVECSIHIAHVAVVPTCEEYMKCSRVTDDRVTVAGVLHELPPHHISVKDRGTQGMRVDLAAHGGICRKLRAGVPVEEAGVGRRGDLSDPQGLAGTGDTAEGAILLGSQRLEDVVDHLKALGIVRTDELARPGHLLRQNHTHHVRGGSEAVGRTVPEPLGANLAALQIRERRVHGSGQVRESLQRHVAVGTLHQRRSPQHLSSHRHAGHTQAFRNKQGRRSAAL